MDQTVKIYITVRDSALTTEQLLTRFGRQYCGELGICLGDDAFAVERTVLGKPFFPCLPGVHTSVSHSGAYFVCAFSPVPVGIDLQQCACEKNEMDRHLALAKRYFSEREQRWMAEDPSVRFFQLWTARESFVKMTGQGIGKGFSRLCMLPEGRMVGEAWEWESSLGCFRQACCPEGYLLSLCSETPVNWQINSVE